ncbi:MAG: hypothetical protein P1S46_07525 [bacterium]|nr:hypothetical protein [bacterium]
MSRTTDKMNVLWKTIRRHWIVASLIGLYLIASILTGTVVGRVTDADTGEPLDGVVIMAHWKWDWIPLPLPPEGGTIQMDTVTETVSRRGWFVVFRPTMLLFSYPSVTVWNEGYVVWNSRYNFDGKSQWGSDRTIHPTRYGMRVPLQPWEERMGHCAQEFFIRRRFSDVSDYNRGDIKTPLMREAKASEGDLCRAAGGPYEERKKQ